MITVLIILLVVSAILNLYQLFHSLTTQINLIQSHINDLNSLSAIVESLNVDHCS